MARGGATRWKPGVSPNPSGKGKGFAALCKAIRAETGQGKELMDFALRVFRGEPDEKSGKIPAHDDRWKALEWLADRAFGKAVTPIDLSVVDEVQDADDFDPASIPRAARDELDRAYAKALLAAGITDQGLLS